MSTGIAVMLLVVVIVVVGLGGYAGLRPLQTAPATRSTCEPRAACVPLTSTNDVTLFVPYSVDAGQTYSQVAVGVPVPAAVGVQGGEPIRTYSVAWAPGQTTSNSSGSLSYAYSTPGVYAVSATATATDGVVHTGSAQLVPLKVNPSAASVESGYYPSVDLALRNATGGPFPWVGAGESVTVSGSYTAPPVDALFRTNPPTLTTPSGATRSDLTSTGSRVSAQYDFPTAGYYPITLVTSVANATTTLTQNYTWGVYVGATASELGCTECATPVVSSPHPETLVDYDLAAGGALTLDPAADYYSVGYEVGQSIDESLIYFNGTDSGQTPTNFVPGAATCVPGSALCTKLYGQSLVKGDNYTFVIDTAAHFYDPYTGVSREVYPSDVMFSIIRAIMYTQVGTVTGYYVGSDIAGPLVPYAGLSPNDVNASWDLGVGGAPLHYPYNNTPYWTLHAFSVNDTAYCPTTALAANGCLTLHADADGRSWPALLQILSLISAGGIEASGWYTAHGANVPGFVCPADPDSPCLLPGDTNTTNSTAFEDAVSTLSPEAWDPEISAGATHYPAPVPAVAFDEVGSGPYYLAYANPTVGYVLKANPAYEPPTGCAGAVGCLPAKGAYVPNVITYWDDNDARGTTETEVGYADAAAFESTDFPLMLSRVQNGQLGLLSVPTPSTDNFGFNLHVDLTVLQTYDSQPLDLKADTLSYEGLRATLEYAYPYQTAQAVGNVVDGIDLGNPFGGFLPPSESAFYDPQLPWPNYNVSSETFSNPEPGGPTSPGTAGWYWSQANDCPSGPLCDPELASYSPGDPLVIPILGYVTSPNIDAMETAWGDSVANVTGAVVQFQQLYAPEGLFCLTIPCYSWPISWVGWIPDYPSPGSSWQDAYGPTGIWADQDELSATLTQNLYGGAFNDTTVCGHVDPTFANMTYWATQADQVIPQVCQGTAWNVTTAFATQATYSANVTAETDDWDLVQAVYNNLQLSVGAVQSNTLFAFAPWIDPSTINTNAWIGGGGEWAWYAVGGNGLD